MVGADAVTFFVGKTIVNSTELLSMLWKMFRFVRFGSVLWSIVGPHGESGLVGSSQNCTDDAVFFMVGVSGVWQERAVISRSAAGKICSAG